MTALSYAHGVSDTPLLGDDTERVTGVFAMNSPREFVRTSLKLAR